MARVEWTDEARSDLRRVIDRLAGVVSAATARKWGARFRAAFQRIADTPEQGLPVEDVDITGLREWLVGPYRVLYRSDRPVPAILRIVRAERDLGGLLDDDE